MLRHVFLEKIFKTEFKTFFQNALLLFYDSSNKDYDNGDYNNNYGDAKNKKQSNKTDNISQNNCSHFYCIRFKNKLLIASIFKYILKGYYKYTAGVIFK